MGSYAESKHDPLGILLNHETTKLIGSVLSDVHSKSKVLYVGCEASSPLILQASSAGHEVYGIDQSQASIDSIRKLVTGNFEAVDETEYQPNLHFDTIFAIFSLYRLSRAQITSLVFRMSGWLKPGGSIVLATSLTDDLVTTLCHECVDDCTRDYPLMFNGTSIRSTLYSRNGWVTLCQKAGLEFASETSFPVQTDSEQPLEKHSFLKFRKVEDHAIMGPYPLPTSYRGPIPLSEAAWKPFAKRLVRDEFDFVLKVLEKSEKVLDVGSGYGSMYILGPHCVFND